MAKKAVNHKEELRKRKFKIPPYPVAFLYRHIMGGFIMPKYRIEFKITDDINDCKGPCFLIWNHMSRIDHCYLMKAAWPRRINIVASYTEFFRSHLHTVFKLNQCLPKKNFTTDIPGLKAIQSIINQGGCVAFSPEGMSSIYGTNQPVVAGTGHYLRHFRVPIYFCEMHGEYLQNTKVCLDERYGKTTCEMKLLFSVEDLDRMTDEEVETKINEAFRNDDYEWGRAHHIKWKTNGEICKRLDDICYKCPKCGAELQMKAEKNHIECTACGNGATMDDYYEFHPYKEDSVIPVSPSKWVEWERGEVIKAIRKDPAFSYTIHAPLGEIPSDHWTPNKRTTEICGEGDLTLDHSGIHFRGTKRGEPFSFDLNYGIVYSLIVNCATNAFAFYAGGEHYELFPEEHVGGKCLLIIEEMHRYHYNYWKNFPWLDYLYEGMECGIDVKKPEGVTGE